MRLKFIIITMIALSVAAHGAIAQKLSFSDEKSWASAKEQALKENKYIFMEVGATWCGPCHLMEKEVFSKDSVGDFYNKHFINVKLQADKTFSDNGEIKNWYADADKILKDYAINAFPTYLFFSPQGELVYRGVGAMPVKDFVALGKNALDPAQNIILRKEAFSSRKMDVSKEGNLAVLLHRQGDKLADTVANDYMKRYLDNANDAVLMLPENLTFIVAFQSIIQPKSKYFELLYKHGDAVDSILNRKGISQFCVIQMVTLKEVIKPIYDVKTGKIIDANPDWNKIRNSVATNYSTELADDIILAEKYKYDTRSKNWPLAVQSGIDWVTKLHMEKTQLANEIAYNTFFKHSDSPKELRIAEKWMKEYLSEYPDAYDVMDTYAGLLYKNGEKQRAIGIEQQAIDLVTKSSNNDDKTDYLPVFNESLVKMKAGKPTWLD